VKRKRAIILTVICAVLPAGCSDDSGSTGGGTKRPLAELPARAGFAVSECSFETGAACPALPAPDSCEFRGPLPDPGCTPGALNPDVTQDTLETTLCRPGGYTDSVRPPRGYTDSLKPRFMAAYGVDSEPLGDYELDHLIPLGLGGAAADPRNLWPQPEFGPDSASEKNDLAGALNQAVCAGEIGLAAAQRDLLEWAGD
jgi:hypothetical protein